MNYQDLLSTITCTGDQLLLPIDWKVVLKDKFKRDLKDLRDKPYNKYRARVVHLAYAFAKGTPLKKVEKNPREKIYGYSIEQYLLRNIFSIFPGPTYTLDYEERSNLYQVIHKSIKEWLSQDDSNC